MTHNSHMLAFSAMMVGREQEAMAAARAMWDDLPDMHVRQWKGDFVADVGAAEGSAVVDTGSGDVRIVTSGG